MRHQSHIERNARLGQTSEQLSERNTLRRMAFYGVLGGIAGGVFAQLTLNSFQTVAVMVGGLLGLALAIAIDEKMKRVDQAKRARYAKDRAAEQERERQAMIAQAKANGDFDRWDQSR